MSARQAKGTKSQRPRRSDLRVAAMQERLLPEEGPPRGPMPFFRVGRGAVGEGDPWVRKRRPKSGMFFFASQHRSRPPGTRAARALRRRILAGDCAPCVRREALRLPSGPGSPLQLCPRLSQGALSVRAGRPMAAAPLASPSCSLSLLLPLACPPALGLQLPGLPRGGESVSSEDCTHLQRPGLLARRAPAPAGCREQRGERTGPSSSCSEPRVWGEGKPASSSSGSRSDRQRLGCSLAGLGAEDQQIQLA